MNQMTEEELIEAVNDCRYERKLILRKLRNENREPNSWEKDQLDMMEKWLCEAENRLIEVQCAKWQSYAENLEAQLQQIK